MYSDRTFSETAAVIMRTGSAIMLVPATFGLFFSAIGFLMSLIGGSPIGVLVFSIPFFSLGLGIALFVGYCKLASRQLEAHLERWLWIATIVFNSIPLFGIAYGLNKVPATELFSNGRELMIPLAIWWIAAVILSSLALAKNNADQKYR